MSVFKRLSTTLFSRVDQVVSEIENHDAIIEASIRDNKQALAKARVRFNRLKADGRKLRERLDKLRESEAQWSRRASEQADKDEDTALRCLRKRRECRGQIEQLERSIADHREAESGLSDQLETMEQRIKEVTRQKNLLRTRQSTADAMRTFKAIEDCAHVDIDDTFEKWEVKVMEAEMSSDVLNTTDSPDDLECRFANAEEMADLKAELDELRNKEKNDDH